MPTPKQMEKLTSDRLRTSRSNDPAPDSTLPPEYWDAVLREPRDKHQHFHCRLPLWRFVLGLRKLGDIVAGVLECHKLAPARQVDRIFERAFPPFWLTRRDLRPPA
jgi:hypothetical protein